MTTYLRKNYFRFCEELGINKIDAKRLKNEKGSYLFIPSCAKNEKDFKNNILRIYSTLLLRDLGLLYSDNNYFFKTYSDNNYSSIRNLEELLSDRHYEYNGFLFENLVCLKYSLIEPITQLKNITNLDISDIEKYREKKDLEKEIYKVFDTFFKMVNNLMKEYVSNIYSKDAKIVNSGILDGLKRYSSLLDDIKSDMKKRTGIF